MVSQRAGDDAGAISAPAEDAPSFCTASASSPVTAASASASDTGEVTRSRKPPSVTPRTFRRFFTPRSSLGGSREASSSRHALRDITNPVNNGNAARHRSSAALEPFSDIPIYGDEKAHGKRQRLPVTPDTSPEPLTPSKRRKTVPNSLVLDKPTRVEPSNTPLHTPFVDSSDHHKHDLARPLQKRHIVRFNEKSVNARVLRRSVGCDGESLGTSHCAGQSRTMSFSNHLLMLSRQVGSMRLPTSSASRLTSMSVLILPGQNGCLPSARPAATVRCHTHNSAPLLLINSPANTLVAVGDEKGSVRLLESARNSKPGFQDAYLSFQPHDNAILDLAFSSDDMLLATASGDQTARIIDMPTRRILTTLAGHTSSVKQVHFQAGSGANNIIATSSRDGSVNIWDLRCKGLEGPVRKVGVSLDAENGNENDTSTRNMSWARPVNSIFDAHPDRRPLNGGSLSRATMSADTSSRSESPGSVTALAFLPPGREQLLLTASEGNACLRLWDLRTTHTHRRGRAVPLSTTRQPESHDKYRHFGTNALAVSGDGGRVYSLCRDNTVYAYSTNHLILGHAPELSHPGGRPRRSGGTGKEGLGPIYGVRHAQLHTATFYVKLSLRKARADKPELLATGSSDGCAVVIPTSDSYMARSRLQDSGEESVAGMLGATLTPATTPQTPRPGLSRSSSISGLAGRLVDTIPVHHHGSALIRGHQREVTGVCWNSEGELITAGDDFLVRCWREGSEARDLRRGGEGDGRRWGCGWAEADETDDED